MPHGPWDFFESPLIRVGSRRWCLQAGLAGLASACLTSPLNSRVARADAPQRTSANDRKSVILIWLSGGPSHLDMWDPKPDAPSEIRGPYSAIATRVPGV